MFCNNLGTRKKGDLMRNDEMRELYTALFLNKYEAFGDLFIIEIADENHIFWAACRDVASEALSKSHKWYWIVNRIDDFGNFFNILINNYWQI